MLSSFGIVVFRKKKLIKNEITEFVFTGVLPYGFRLLPHIHERLITNFGDEIFIHLIMNIT